MNLTIHNLRHRRMGVTDHGQYDAWLSLLKDVPTYDGSSKSIPKWMTKKYPFHANGLDWDEHGRPVEYDDRHGRFIRRTGYGPPSCYCGASLEWRHQEWPPPTERCRQCKLSLAPRERGQIRIGGPDEYDYGLMSVLAREWTTTIRWISDNIKIVIPASLQEQAFDYLEGQGKIADMSHLVSLDEGESRIQAVWEIDKFETKRHSYSDELVEFETANWNSMFQPQLFPPSVLYPSSPKWTVRIEVLQSQGVYQGPIKFFMHPNTTIPEMAQDILSRLGLDGIQHRTQLSLTQNGDVITAGTEQGHRNKIYNTIASSEWITPIRVLCIVWDEGDEGTDFY